MRPNTRFSSLRVKQLWNYKEERQMQNFVLKNSAGVPQRVCILIWEPRSLTQENLVYVSFVVKPHKLPGATWIWECWMIFSWSNLWLGPGWYWELRRTGISEINSFAVPFKRRGNTERARACRRESKLDIGSKLGRHSSSLYKLTVS